LQTVGETKLYSLTESSHAYIRYLRDRNPETGEAVDLNEERAKLAKAKRLKAELELQVEKGELHRAEDVEKIMTATLVNFKSRLSAIPAEEAEKLATMTDKAKIFIYLNDRIKEALAELSNFEAIFKEEIKEDEKGND
jgi:phage terminase Nu1 subunit (DNA packaging protein)